MTASPATIAAAVTRFENDTEECRMAAHCCPVHDGSLTMSESDFGSAAVTMYKHRCGCATVAWGDSIVGACLVFAGGYKAAVGQAVMVREMMRAKGLV